LSQSTKELIAYCRGTALALRAIHGDRAAFRKWAREYFKDLEDDLFERAFANNAAM